VIDWIAELVLFPSMHVYPAPEQTPSIET
jgi:hypothetical protein